MNDPEPSRGNKVRRGSLLQRLREAVHYVKWLLHFRVAPEQPPQSFELNNEASNYGAQGTFYGPVSFEQNFGISKKRLSTAYIQVIFEKYPRYPLLNFSVINSGEQPVQITSIRVIKAVSMKDEHALERHLLGPRTKLEFSLQNSPEGTWVQAFGSAVVSNLNPGEAEAFQLVLDCENTVNLLDLEVEFLSSGEEQAEVYISPNIIVIQLSPAFFQPVWDTSRRSYSSHLKETGISGAHRRGTVRSMGERSLLRLCSMERSVFERIRIFVQGFIRRWMECSSLHI